MQRRAVLIGGTSLAAAAVAARAAPAPVPSAVLEGPIPGGPIYTGDRPPGAAEALKRHGYVEAEYIVSGTVGGRPYRTTMLVRRPADLRRFSGLAVVEPVHVGGASMLWPLGGEEIMAGGHGYALVGAQRVPVDQTIRPVNPARYAGLVMPQATAAEIEAIPLAGVLAAAPPALAVQLRASVAEGPLSQKIMSQVGVLLKGPKGAGPFGRTPRWLVTGGYSQTGGLTLNYLRSEAPTARTAAGQPIYDGYLPLGASGDGPVLPHPGKVMHVMGEGDYLNYASSKGSKYRRPDSDRPGDHYRLWEIAGGSHGATRGRPPEALKGYAPDEIASQFPSEMIYAAAISNLFAWVAKGVAPPKAERLQLAADGAVVRDAYGNALGGVRSSYLDAPTKTIVAVAPPRPGFFDRNFQGLEIPLPKETLQRLYPTHAAYVAKVQASVAALVKGRWLLPADGKALVQEAQNAAVP